MRTTAKLSAALNDIIFPGKYSRGVARQAKKAIAMTTTKATTASTAGMFLHHSMSRPRHIARSIDFIAQSIVAHAALPSQASDTKLSFFNRHPSAVGSHIAW